MSEESRPVGASVSRRAILAAGVGTGAAAAAATLMTALPAAAGSGTPIHVGDHLTNATSVTSLTNTANSADVFRAVSQGSGDALSGQSATGNGVRGQTNSSSDAGVFGLNTSKNGFSLGVWGATKGTTGSGVYGSASDGGTGVVGISAVNDPGPRTKVGVFGFSDVGAVAQGVRGESPTGRGVVASGSIAQLRLVPSTHLHPTTGALGDFFLDKNSKLWFCKGGTNWKQIA